ncbi:hypothetical protein GH5_02328 [Leishmania sp. Ghana 2012 LV757]|uniref:hypothetical protein n=1 Tax=Leishmania sp. Ghana 2012 LV757 TaxID=2803181 RepID=UPI001B6AA7DA|nr:hypothetical protein GH5_02328 [Leishmania sp. Ghana 2012 LV757]
MRSVPRTSAPAVPCFGLLRRTTLIASPRCTSPWRFAASTATLGTSLISHSGSSGSSVVACSCLSLQRAHIRTVIPPRPAVTTLVYLDHSGRAVRTGVETDLSLIRTRDNKFYLQRVLPNGEVVRWLAPGLNYLKNVTNFETYALNDIDENGGVVIPSDVMPTAAHDVPGLRDAVFYMTKLEATSKFTRKDRRRWHRRLFAHWKESPEKYLSHTLGTYGVAFLVMLWVCVRGFHSIKNQKPFWDVNVYGLTDEERERTNPWLRLKRFSERHPEHEGVDMTVTMLSPGQSRLSSARSELRESDFTDPHYHSEFWWKVRHCYYYGHWPKGLVE